MSILLVTETHRKDRVAVIEGGLPDSQKDDRGHHQPIPSERLERVMSDKPDKESHRDPCGDKRHQQTHGKQRHILHRQETDVFPQIK